jgi:hypothetical protein
MNDAPAEQDHGNEPPMPPTHDKKNGQNSRSEKTEYRDEFFHAHRVAQLRIESK